MLAALVPAAVAGHACPIDRAECVLRGTAREDADLSAADRDFHRACQKSDWKDRVRLLQW